MMRPCAFLLLTLVIAPMSHCQAFLPLSASSPRHPAPVIFILNQPYHWHHHQDADHCWSLQASTQKDDSSTKGDDVAVPNKYNNESLIFGLPRDSVGNPLGLLLTSQFLLFIGVGCVIPSIPLYGKEIGLSSAANGIVISAPAVALLLLANFSGKYADKARKPAMMAGMALIVVSDLGTALAQTLPVLIVARLGLGAGRGISEAGERGLLADLAGRVPDLRGRALAAQQAVVALGVAIGAPLGGLIVEKYGPRASFLCVSAAAMVALVAYIFLPETTTRIESSSLEQEEVVTNSANNHKDKSFTQEQQQQVEWSELLQDNRWKGLALCQCGTSFGFAAKIASIPILATNTLPGGAVGAGALLSAAGLSGLVGAPIGGWLTDRTSSQSAAVLSGVTSGLALAFIPVALSSTWLSEKNMNLVMSSSTTMNGSAAVFVVLVLLWSISVAAQGPAMTALAQELAPVGSKATAMALPRAAGDGTYIVAPFLMGLVADAATDAIPGAECALAGLVALAGSLALAVLSNVASTNDRNNKSE